MKIYIDYILINNAMICFKDVVVCKFAGCNQVFNDARILPCGKRTCAAHIDEMIVKSDNDNVERKMIKCHFCQKIHSFSDDPEGFLVDENIPLLLNIMYGKEHSAAKKNFNELAQLIDKLAKIDKEGFVIDYFERVEADIVQEKEVHMQKLVVHYQQLLDKVHDRKVKCLQNLKTNKALESELDTIKQTLAEHESQLKRENLDFIIKTLDGDEDKWKGIQFECAALLEKVRSLEEELKERIIGDQITEFKPSANDTPIEDICGSLDTGTIDSTIISTEKLKNDLVALCKLSRKQFKLIYRATTDGFAAASFHTKCDNQPKTLTIVKASSGDIFSGYTSVAWDSTGNYKADPNAFLFSLINVRFAPQLMPVKAGGANSIFCNASYGQTFGSGHDILISNNSNLTNSSRSYLSSYNFTTPVNGLNPTQTFLAGSSNLKTSEIEVFKLN